MAGSRKLLKEIVWYIDLGLFYHLPAMTEVARLEEFTPCDRVSLRRFSALHIRYHAECIYRLAYNFLKVYPFLCIGIKKERIILSHLLAFSYLQ